MNTSIRLIGFARQLLHFAGFKSLSILLLSLIAGVTEGIGLVMLIPLLALFYPGIVSDENSALQYLGELLDSMGIAHQLEPILVVFVLLLLAQSAISYLRDRVTLKLHLSFIENLRMQLYQAIMGMRWDAFSATRTSDFTHSLTTDINRVAQGTHAILQLLSSGIMACFYLMIALYMSPLFTLLTIISGILLSLLIRPINRRVHVLGEQYGQGHGAMLHAIGEHLASLKLAKCFSAQQRHVDEFQSHIAGLREQQLHYQHNNSLTRSILRLGGGLSLTLCVYWGIKGAQLPLPQLLVLIYTFSRLLPLISGLQQSYQQLLHMLPAYQATQDLLQGCRADAETPFTLSKKPQPLIREIQLHGVSFSYPNEPQRQVIQQVNLTICARKTTALVGPSGGGKSTLADLVIGLLEPTEGRITVDGKALDVQAWRANIAHVPQDTFLFHHSIRHNLLWAAPQATEKDLWEVLEMAAATAFIKRLPLGLDSIVGERGIQLSGGERQRIALARALLRKPALLVLDEATSSLDHDSEEKIREAMANLHGNLTMLVIAHRPSTLQEADYIAVIQQGKITEQGVCEVTETTEDAGYLGKIGFKISSA